MLNNQAIKPILNLLTIAFSIVKKCRYTRSSLNPYRISGAPLQIALNQDIVLMISTVSAVCCSVFVHFVVSLSVVKC